MLEAHLYNVAFSCIVSCIVPLIVGLGDKIDKDDFFQLLIIGLSHDQRSAPFSPPGSRINRCLVMNTSELGRAKLLISGKSFISYDLDDFLKTSCEQKFITTKSLV